MSVPSEQLRLAVALAHTVAGARLHLWCADGQEVLVGRDAECDLEICALRRVVLAADGSACPDPSAHVERMELTGSLRFEGGVHRSEHPTGPRRWFASLLRPERVESLLAALGPEGPAADLVDAVLRPDLCLGVTVVGLEPSRPDLPTFLTEPALDAMALAALQTCATDELLHQVTVGSHRAHPPSPSDRRTGS